jgi:hypothetical protein
VTDVNGTDVPAPEDELTVASRDVDEVKDWVPVLKLSKEEPLNVVDNAASCVTPEMESVDVVVELPVVLVLEKADVVEEVVSWPFVVNPVVGLVNVVAADKEVVLPDMAAADSINKPWFIAIFLPVLLVVVPGTNAAGPKVPVAVSLVKDEVDMLNIFATKFKDDVSVKVGPDAVLSVDVVESDVLGGVVSFANCRL